MIGLGEARMLHCFEGVRRLSASLNGSEHARRAILVLAIAFLVAGIGVSLQRHPGILSDLDWQAVALILVLGVPATIALNAAEFIVQGRAVGQSVPWWRATSVTVVGTAANMLPLPGALMVRVAALKAGGAGLRASSFATLLVSVIWLGIAFVYAGGWILFMSEFALGAAFTVAGLAVLAAGAILFSRVSSSKRLALQAVIVKLAMVALDAARTFLCFQALGIEASFAQASALTAAAAAGSSLSIIPAGLGIREALTAALAPLIGLGAALGFLTATLNRVLGLSVILPLAFVLILRRSRSTGAKSRKESSQPA